MTFQTPGDQRPHCPDHDRGHPDPLPVSPPMPAALFGWPRWIQLLRFQGVSGPSASEGTTEAALWCPSVQLEAPLFHSEVPQVQHTKLDQFALHSLVDVPTFAGTR